MAQPPVGKNGEVDSIFRSPRELAILALGILLVLGAVFYVAARSFPGLFKNGIPNPITGDVTPSKADQNAGIDFSELNNLPDDYGTGAADILAREEGALPEPLMDLQEASGPGLIYPVTESVETVQPTLSWTLFAPGPFKLVVKDKNGQVVGSTQNLPRTFFVSPKLTAGATYTWEVTAANGESVNAQFVVLSPEQTGDWLRVRSKFSESHLALGVVAEQLGMLTVAEREYQEFGKQFPKAEAPARLLENVQALRD